MQLYAKLKAVAPIVFFTFLTACGGFRPNQMSQNDTDSVTTPDSSSTPSPPSDSGTPPSQQHTIKWNPGHYMASNGIVEPGATIANSDFLPWELADLNNQNSIVGYRMLITWAAIEPTEGNYDFSQIDSVLNYLETQLNTPKHLVLVVLPGNFTSTTCGSATIPSYILNDSAYGPSPVSGSYGWWGGTGNGNTCSATLYRPAVMARWVALQQALGAYYDSNPYFEAIMFQEDSWVMGAWTTNNPPDYPGDSTMLSDFENILSATLVAFPHTNVIFQNTWGGSATTTTELEQFMVQNRVAPSTADTFGQTYVNSVNSTCGNAKPAGGLNSWGMNAFIGLDPYYDSSNCLEYTSGTDYRSEIHSMVDIEAPDLGLYQDMGGTEGMGGYSPQDICNALNQSYEASHAFWTWLGSNPQNCDSSGNCSSVPSASWQSITAVTSTCPLVNTSYPAMYP